MDINNKLSSLDPLNAIKKPLECPRLNLNTPNGQLCPKNRINRLKGRYFSCITLALYSAIAIEPVIEPKPREFSIYKPIANPNLHKLKRLAIYGY